MGDLRTDSESSWLPDELKSDSADEQDRPAGEWVLLDELAPFRQDLTIPSPPEPPNGESGVRPAAPPPQLRHVEEAIAERIDRLDKTLADQRATIAELEHALERREAELAKALRDRDEAPRREADLQERLNGQRAELERQLDEVEERHDVREAELRQHAKQREAELRRRIEELEGVLAEAQQRAITKTSRRRPGPIKGGRVDLNDATFEQLRDLGLSVTLSARVVSYRDARGGFGSIDELDEIPGLSVELTRVLKDQLTLA